MLLNLFLSFKNVDYNSNNKVSVMLFRKLNFLQYLRIILIIKILHVTLYIKFIRFNDLI